MISGYGLNARRHRADDSHCDGIEHRLAPADTDSVIHSIGCHRQHRGQTWFLSVRSRSCRTPDYRTIRNLGLELLRLGATLLATENVYPCPSHIAQVFCCTRHSGYLTHWRNSRDPRFWPLLTLRATRPAAERLGCPGRARSTKGTIWKLACAAPGNPVVRRPVSSHVRYPPGTSIVASAHANFLSVDPDMDRVTLIPTPARRAAARIKAPSAAPSY